MTAVVFVGPSLRPGDRAAAAGLQLLPPVRQGDVVRAVRRGASAIGIVDGYFDSVPAVWHKEILWAMAEGVPVLGSSSMGALRAAELHGFGMIGVGRVFEWYRDGVFWQDDAVALTHGPGEVGYPALSEPLVNVHATALAAREAGVLDATAAEALVEAARAIFYKRRSWDAVLDAAAAQGMVLDDFRDWLGSGRVDQKRHDALALLAQLQAIAADRRPATPVRYRLAWTNVWDRLHRRAIGEAAQRPATEVRDADVLDELRLRPGDYRAVAAAALLRLAAQGAVESAAGDDDATVLAAALNALRLRHGLMTRAGLEAWMAENGLTGEALGRVLAGRAAVAAAAGRHADLLAGAMLDELGAEGRYGPLAARAATKRAALDGAGSGPAVSAAALVDWYFGAGLGAPVPDDLDAFCREIGLDNREAWYRILRREHRYRALAQT